MKKSSACHSNPGVLFGPAVNKWSFPSPHWLLRPAGFQTWAHFYLYNICLELRGYVCLLPNTCRNSFSSSRGGLKFIPDTYLIGWGGYTALSLALIPPSWRGGWPAHTREAKLSFGSGDDPQQLPAFIGGTGSTELSTTFLYLPGLWLCEATKQL